MWTAESFKMPSMIATLPRKLGCADSISATAPVTSGVAMLVPLRMNMSVPTLFCGYSFARVMVDGMVETILLPGATLQDVPKFLRRFGRLDFSRQWEDSTHVEELVCFVNGRPFRDGVELPDEPSPYRGLERFEATDAEFFFGRDREIRDLAQLLRSKPFVAVVGHTKNVF